MDTPSLGAIGDTAVPHAQRKITAVPFAFLADVKKLSRTTQNHAYAVCLKSYRSLLKQ